MSVFEESDLAKAIYSIPWSRFDQGLPVFDSGILILPICVTNDVVFTFSA